MASLAYMTGEYPRATDTFIQREIAALRELGYSIQTFAARKPKPEQILDRTGRLERGATRYLLPLHSFRTILAQYYLSWRHPNRNRRASILAIKTCPLSFTGIFKQQAYLVEAARLAWEMKKLNIRHLHNHFSDSSCTVAMLASVLGGFTYSFTVHGPADFVKPTYWRMAEKVRRASFVICISEYARQCVLEIAGPEAANKLHVVHCGVDSIPSTPSPGIPGEGWGEGLQNNRLLFIGRLTEAKGLPILLRALALIRQTKPAQLKIIGDGPDRPALEKLSAELNLSDAVEFLGYQPQSRVREILNETDVFVMTSRAEGVPVVLMEAMAAGLPVVAPRIAGIPELVDDGQNGFLTPVDDPNATAEAVLTLLADPKLREQFGKEGKKKVEEQFNVQIEAKKLADLFTAAGIPTSQSLVPSPQSYVLVSPCRDEAKHLRRTMDSVLAQSVLPKKWIIVDDGSSDGTSAMLTEYAAEHPFIQIVSRPNRGFRELGRGVIDTFYDGYNTIKSTDFDYLAKLDLDIELPPLYFEILMRKMNDQPRLGTCSGKPHYVHPVSGKIVHEPCGDEQSVGMVKFYRRTCFEQIGGFVHELMWDGIDGHRCRMLGWIAASYDQPELRFEHMRPMGSSDKSWWTGRKRHGEGQYFMGTSLAYILASGIYRIFQPPVLVGSIAMVWGYVQNMAKRHSRYGDAEFRRFLQRYQWDCLVKGKAKATQRINAQQTEIWRFST
jgi:biofilm PGA synthesis N-glycosyltransferase PgaC